MERLSAEPDGHVTFREVMAHLQMKDTRNFKRDIRRHEDFRDELAERGVVEWGAGRWPNGFKRMSAACGFSAIEEEE